MEWPFWLRRNTCFLLSFRMFPISSNRSVQNSCWSADKILCGHRRLPRDKGQFVSMLTLVSASTHCGFVYVHRCKSVSHHINNKQPQDSFYWDKEIQPENYTFLVLKTEIKHSTQHNLNIRRYVQISTWYCMNKPCIVNKRSGKNEVPLWRGPSQPYSLSHSVISKI